jgi:hypothetical protein
MNTIASTHVDTPYGEKTLDMTYEIPYLAGYSEDGKTIFIDKRLNPIFSLSDGRKMDITKYLVVHESTEKHLMDTKDYKYGYAHQKATGLEREVVEADGYPWDEYQKYALSEVQRLKKLDPEAPLPPNLDNKPEIDTHDYGFLKTIHRHQKLKKKGHTMLQSVACNIKCLADNIMDPHIINPLPSLQRKAQSIYQDLVDSKEGRALYDNAKKRFSGNVLAMADEILSSLRDKIMEAAKDDPKKFQLIRAYVRDKIEEGLR